MIVIWVGEMRGAQRQESTHGCPILFAFLLLPPALLTSPALSVPLQSPRKDAKPLHVFSLLYFLARDRRQEEKEAGP